MSWWVHSTNGCGHCRYRGDPDSGGLAGWTYRVARYIRQWQSVSLSKMAREQYCISLPSVRLRIRYFSVHRLRQPSSSGQEVSEMSAVWQEELGDGAHEEGLAKRLFHPFQEGGPSTSVCSRRPEPGLQLQSHRVRVGRDELMGEAGAADARSVSPLATRRAQFSGCWVSWHGVCFRPGADFVFRDVSTTGTSRRATPRIRSSVGNDRLHIQKL